MFWDGIMPQTSRRKRESQSAAEQAAFTARILKGLNKTIDEQIALTRDLQIEHDLALYRAGKNPALDADECMKEARRRIG